MHAHCTVASHSQGGVHTCHSNPRNAPPCTTCGSSFAGIGGKTSSTDFPSIAACMCARYQVRSRPVTVAHTGPVSATLRLISVIHSALGSSRKRAASLAETAKMARKLRRNRAQPPVFHNLQKSSYATAA